MGNSDVGNGGGQMFGVDDAGGLVGGATSSACVRQWYVNSGGGLGAGAGATSGSGTTGGTSRGTSSMVEEKKGVVSKIVTSAETRYR